MLPERIENPQTMDPNRTKITSLPALMRLGKSYTYRRPMTRFPGGTELIKLTLNPSPEINPKREQRNSSNPLPVNQPSAAP